MNQTPLINVNIYISTMLNKSKCISHMLMKKYQICLYTAVYRYIIYVYITYVYVKYVYYMHIPVMIIKVSNMLISIYIVSNISDVNIYIYAYGIRIKYVYLHIKHAILTVCVGHLR